MKGEGDVSVQARVAEKGLAINVLQSQGHGHTARSVLTCVPRLR